MSKIAQITCVYPPYKGGIATSARDFAQTLRLSGKEIETFTIKIGSPVSLKNDNVSYLRTFPGFGKGGFLPQLFFCLKSFDVVVLHYPFFGAAEIIWFLKKFIWKNKKKLVIHYHMDTVLPNLFLKVLSIPSILIFNSLFKNANVIVSASLDYVKNSQLKNIYKKYPEKFIEIPFGVDINKFQPMSLSQISIRDRGMTSLFKILFVGGLDGAHYFKGVNILLEAIAKISNCQLSIVGSGDLEESYKEKTRELGIDKRVNFLGNISNEDLPKKYQEADCLVLPSINKGEAFGIVLIEAMSSGLPVISSNLPGVRGVFENGRQGLLVNPGDVDDLVEKIKYLIENLAVREKMATEARLLAKEKYSKEIVDKKLSKFFID